MKTLMKIGLILIAGVCLLEVLGGGLLALLKIPGALIAAFGKIIGGLGAAFAKVFSGLFIVVLPIVALVFVLFIVVKLISSLCRGKEKKSRLFQNGETKILQEINEGLKKMEKRLDSLEVIFDLKK